ncbi:hypothetical protein V565_111710, partial [Rhizoctonia solani 123E]
MGISVHSRWGPPLEQYVFRYDKSSVRNREVLEDDIMSSARQCMQSITTISKEADDIVFDSLAKKVTLEMLRCLFLLSHSGHDGVVSPFGYEYGYLCFNVAKMALGVCLIEKFNRQNICTLMERVWCNYQTKDNPSILTELLSEIFLNETATFSPGESRCDWIFGWSDPPAHGGHSGLIVAESDALDLMNVLWNDRKAFLKSLSSTYTPGVLIMNLPIWQRMLRNGLQRELPVPPQVPLLGPFLDLSWRFALVAKPGDYGLILPMGIAAMYHLGKLTTSAVDAEDSRAIIRAYIEGIPIIKNTLLYHQAGIGAYPHLPRFIVHNILPGTEDLFPTFIKTLLGRMWEMVLWEDVFGMIPPIAFISGGLDDLLLFLQLHA